MRGSRGRAPTGVCSPVAAAAGLPWASCEPGDPPPVTMRAPTASTMQARKTGTAALLRSLGARTLALAAVAVLEETLRGNLTRHAGPAWGSKREPVAGAGAWTASWTDPSPQKADALVGSSVSASAPTGMSSSRGPSQSVRRRTTVASSPACPCSSVRVPSDSNDLQSFCVGYPLDVLLVQ